LRFSGGYIKYARLLKSSSRLRPIAAKSSDVTFSQTFVDFETGRNFILMNHSPSKRLIRQAVCETNVSH
jgi:hypothetical protein